MKKITINKEVYIYRKSNINITDFNYEGICEKYNNTSYIVINDEQDPRVRLLCYINDDNNNRETFDPLNYSDNIMVILEHGDECFLEDLYEIVSTTNTNGEILYDYLEKNITHDDLRMVKPYLP